MPDDVGGSPFPEGSDHGGADDEFASVVFDEAFVSAARIHEPTAQERLVAAAQARAEAEQTRTRVSPHDESPDERDGFAHGHPDDDYGPEWADDPFMEFPEGYRHRQGRWHRTVAWVLAVVMGVGVVALTVAAIYRGASSGRQQQPPPPGNSRMDPSGSSTPLRPETPRLVQPVVPRT
ncbi:hypothetical protein AQ490_10815 [Wenjunlia vitaminophila]|uniref:Uncharacterized protein n=1 Tax=Wenjunlia vitaminophila TaxID=76728 RepID=A0A0T6LKK1_WENVI|nr:hypothetical protein [Wenjunlia vitaminophila]KRV46401.1 hypothetical protein AQ490_10815 [Wenjunlia vitaminophila]